MNMLVRRKFSYSKVDKEDPEEVRHRRAQFLIYKALEKADYSRRRPSFLRIRLCRLKVKIGKRLKRLRRSMLVSMSVARVGVYKQVTNQLKTWKLFFGHRETIASLPSLFN